MEIAVYGGSFNPPTRAHEAIVKMCLDLPDVEEVWMMPSGDRMDKHFGLRDTDRLNMLSLMQEECFPDEARLRVSRFEMEYVTRPSQTYRTVSALGKRHPTHHFRYVFGLDAYLDMPRWQEGERLQQSLDVLVVPREGLTLNSSTNLTAVLPKPVCEPVSSTEVRRSVAAGVPIDRFVCVSVASYIEECGLYR